MTALRRISAVLVGTYVAVWVAGILVRLVDVPSGVGYALLVLAAAIGGYGGYHEARTLRPYAGREHRDAIVGWSIVIVPIGVIASFLVPMPWALLAAGLWVVAVVSIARSLLASASTERSSRGTRAGPGLGRSAR